jgi:hypothetical protein
MIKIKLKPNQSLNKNVWKSYKSENISQQSNRALSKTYGHILRKTLNNDQIVEYDLIKKLSEKFIIDNYDRNPTFRKISKTSIGYTITRSCVMKQKVDCRWKININMDTNEVILSCSKECQDENPIKHKGFLFLI